MGFKGSAILTDLICVIVIVEVTTRSDLVVCNPLQPTVLVLVELSDDGLLLCPAPQRIV